MAIIALAQQTKPASSNAMIAMGASDNMLSAKASTGRLPPRSPLTPRLCGEFHVSCGEFDIIKSTQIDRGKQK
jgi:hypothetical protein